MVPPLKFSVKMSAVATSFSTISRPCGLATSTAMLCLFRLNVAKNPAPVPGSRRVLSPCRGSKALEIDAGIEPHRLQQKHQVLGHDVPRSARRIRAAADSGKARIERGDANVERHHHIGQSLPAGIVEMRSAGEIADFLAHSGEEPLHLRRIAVAGGIGETDLVDSASRECHRQPHHIVFLDLAGNRATQRSRHTRFDLGRRMVRVAPRHDVAYLLDHLGVSLSHVGERVWLACRDGNGDLVGARLQGRLRTPQVGHQRHHVQAAQADQRLCLYRVASPHPLRDHTKAGDLLPLNRGAGGRLLQAFDGAKGTLYDEIRKQGIAVTIGDRVAELAGISAPIVDGSGRCLGAVTLSMPVQRFKKRHERTVLAAARSLSAAVGGVLPSRS